MKLKSQNIFVHNLLKLQLLNSKIDKISLNRLKYKLKKVFLTIYRFHVYNKKIIFVSSSKINLNGLKKTNHLILPWCSIKGLITNQIAIFKYIQKRLNIFFNNSKTNKLKKMFLVKELPNLIVLFDNITVEKSFIKEIQKLNIPVIFLKTNAALLKKVYFVFLMLLNSVLKKSLNKKF